MTDRPILFSATMVRAILREISAPGIGKTVTRRILKPQPPRSYNLVGIYSPHLTAVFNPAGSEHRGDPDQDVAIRLPYSLKDRLWVRETWQGLSFGDYLPTKDRVCDLRYAATDPLADSDKDVRGFPWRPGIHMPRWASRLTLVVTDVRVERLQQITEAEAIAEGIERRTVTNLDGSDPQEWWFGADGADGYSSARKAFHYLWDGLNEHRASWEDNPWVVAVRFKPFLANIDRMAA